MKLKIIFYSYTGITRGVAEKIQKSCTDDSRGPESFISELKAQKAEDT